MIALSMLLKLLGKKEIAVIARVLNGYVGSKPEKYEDRHRGCDHGVRNKEKDS